MLRGESALGGHCESSFRHTYCLTHRIPLIPAWELMDLLEQKRICAALKLLDQFERNRHADATTSSTLFIELALNQGRAGPWGSSDALRFLWGRLVGFFSGDGSDRVIRDVLRTVGQFSAASLGLRFGRIREVGLYSQLSFEAQSVMHALVSDVVLWCFAVRQPVLGCGTNRRSEARLDFLGAVGFPFKSSLSTEHFEGDWQGRWTALSDELLPRSTEFNLIASAANQNRRLTRLCWNIPSRVLSIFRREMEQEMERELRRYLPSPVGQ